MYGLGDFDWVAAGFQGGTLATTTLVSTGLMATGVGAPLGAALMAGQQILSSLGIGRGRTEADAIVPVQNASGQRLDEINRDIDRSSIQGLQVMHAEVVDMARKFREFVNDPRFTDGRASIQALDTLMPLIDGTDASGNPCAVNKWGNPCNGGTLGTIERRILVLGGNMPPPQLTQGYGTTIPTLRRPLQSFPYIPQSGTIPPNAPLSPIRQTPVQQIGVSMTDVLPFLLIGGAALFVMRQRRR